jgi:hypothetical protein
MEEKGRYHPGDAGDNEIAEKPLKRKNNRKNNGKGYCQKEEIRI